jgi:hypothetical protein
VSLCQVESLILETLAGIADKGFEAAHVAASLNTIEFRLREFATDADTPKYDRAPPLGVRVGGLG